MRTSQGRIWSPCTTRHADLERIFVGQDSASNPPRAPSTYFIAQNKLFVNESNGAIDVDPESQGYGGVGVYDFVTSPDAPVGETFNADITIFDNDIRIGQFPVMDGVDISGDGKGDIRAIGNRVRGAPYDSGVLVELSRETFVAENDLRSLDPAIADVHLLAHTRECRVIEPGDTVVDEGTNNRVKGVLLPVPPAANAVASFTSRSRQFSRRKL